MDSPIEKFIEWYMTLPVPHREGIASFVAAFNAGFEDVDQKEAKHQVEAFISRIAKYSQDKLRGTGLVLLLRANIDFFFIKKHGSRARWEETQNFLLSTKEHFKAQGKEFMVESANKFLSQLPFNREQWLSTGAKWQELKESHLSDEYVDQWWKE